MDKINPRMADQIAQAASAFEQRRTGHVPNLDVLKKRFDCAAFS